MSDNIETKPVATEDQLLHHWIHQLLYCMVRGTLSCLPQMAVEKVMLMFCIVVAELMCQLYAGDELKVARFRKAARDKFCDTLRAMPTVELDGQPKQSTAAVNTQ